MNTELRKRLEEAAENYPLQSQVKTFIAGGEWMFEEAIKEAIAICNDAIVDATNEFFGDYAQSCALANKVLDKMSKLLEEQK